VAPPRRSSSEMKSATGTGASRESFRPWEWTYRSTIRSPMT